MPINFACVCGKSFKVPDDLAGRRSKCPACGKPLVVPGRTSAPPVTVQSSGPKTPRRRLLPWLLIAAVPAGLALLCFAGIQLFKGILSHDSNKAGVGSIARPAEVAAPSKASVAPTPAATEKAPVDPVAALVKELQNGTDGEKIEAAKALGKMGEKAAPARRALCELAVSKDEKLKVAGLDALDKVWPEASPLLVPIVLAKPEDDSQWDRLQDALLKDKNIELRQASPIFVFAIRRQKEAMRSGLVRSALRYLPKSCLVDRQVQDEIIGLLKGKIDSEILATTLISLRELARLYGSTRPRIAVAVVPFLEAGPRLAIPTLGECGKAARDYIPALEKFKLDPLHRQAAIDAIKKIEADK